MQTITITIPKYKRWQRASKSGHRPWLAIDRGFYSDAKIQHLMKESPETVHVYLWVLFNASPETGELIIRLDYLKTALGNLLAKRSNNFQPLGYLNMLSTSALLCFNMSSTSAELASNLPPTPPVQGIETQSERAPFTNNTNRTNTQENSIDENLPQELVDEMVLKWGNQRGVQQGLSALAKQYPMAQIHNAIQITLDKNPENAMAYLRKVLQNQSTQSQPKPISLLKPATTHLVNSVDRNWVIPVWQITLGVGFFSHEGREYSLAEFTEEVLNDAVA